MLRLISNVRLGLVEQRRADAGSSIARLPFKSPIAEILVAPLGRPSLDELHRFGQSHRRRDNNQYVRVIVEAADGNGRDAVLSRDAAHE